MSNKNDKSQTPHSIWPIFIRRPDLTEDSFYFQGAETKENAIDKLNTWQYWEGSRDRIRADVGINFSALAVSCLSSNDPNCSCTTTDVFPFSNRPSINLARRFRRNIIQGNTIVDKKGNRHFRERQLL